MASFQELDRRQTPRVIVELFRSLTIESKPINKIKDHKLMHLPLIVLGRGLDKEQCCGKEGKKSVYNTKTLYQAGSLPKCHKT